MSDSDSKACFYIVLLIAIIAGIVCICVFCTKKDDEDKNSEEAITPIKPYNITQEEEYHNCKNVCWLMELKYFLN